MTFKMTDKVYAEAEKQYHNYINCINSDNPHYKPTSFMKFQKELSINNPSTLVNFHNWLTQARAQCIQRDLNK